MIKIFFEDKKSFMDKYGQELSDLFFTNKERLPKEKADISYWEKEFKIGPKTARRRLKAYLDEFSSNTEVNQFKDKFGSALFTRFNAIRNLLPAQQKSYRYWLDSTKEELWDVIDEYLPSSYWEKVQEGAELIKETADWEIYKITNYEASEYYGRGTGWCTAGNYPGNENNGLTFFNRYAKEYYFYFNKNTGALYNRFRKNPGQPGADIQIWIGITDDGRTVDNNVSDNKEIKEQLPKIRALDGEEKKAEPVNNTTANNAQVNNANNRRIDVVEYTQFEQETPRNVDVSIYGHGPLDWYICFQASVIRAGFLEFEWDICDDVIASCERFPHEYFTNQEILQINQTLQTPLTGTENEIINAFRNESGESIIQNNDRHFLGDLCSAISELLRQDGYFERNIDRIIQWESEEYPETDIFKVHTENDEVEYIHAQLYDSYDFFSMDCLNIVGTYPPQENNNNAPRSDPRNNIEDRDPIQRGILGYSNRGGYGGNSLGIVDCVPSNIDDEEYVCTLENGERFRATVWTDEGVYTYLDENDRGCLINLIEGLYGLEDIEDLISDYQDLYSDIEGDTHEKLVRCLDNPHARGELAAEVFEQCELQDVMASFVATMSELPRRFRASPDRFVFENGWEWFCIT